MRSHRAIIEQHGAPKIARRLDVGPGTVKQWKRADSIPGPYWHALAESALASLDELARAAHVRRLRRVDPQVAA